MTTTKMLRLLLVLLLLLLVVPLVLNFHFEVVGMTLSDPATLSHLAMKSWRAITLLMSPIPYSMMMAAVVKMVIL